MSKASQQEITPVLQKSGFPEKAMLKIGHLVALGHIDRTLPKEI